MPSPDPGQYDSFAAEYEDHASVAPYNRLYDRPATLRLVGGAHGQRVLDAACPASTSRNSSPDERKSSAAMPHQ
jgi:hypothetical protein